MERESGREMERESRIEVGMERESGIEVGMERESGRGREGERELKAIELKM